MRRPTSLVPLRRVEIGGRGPEDVVAVDDNGHVVQHLTTAAPACEAPPPT